MCGPNFAINVDLKICWANMYATQYQIMVLYSWPAVAYWLHSTISKVEMVLTMKAFDICLFKRFAGTSKPYLK